MHRQLPPGIRSSSHRESQLDTDLVLDNLYRARGNITAVMGAMKTHRSFAALLVVLLLLVQPRPTVADGDLFSKVVDTVTKYFSQDPNAAEKYSAAEGNAEDMQHVHSRRVQYGTDTWKATAVAYYERGLMMVQKYMGYAPTAWIMKWAKSALPQPVTDLLSKALCVAGDCAISASEAVGTGSAYASGAAGLVGKTASDAVKGTTGESFEDLHAKAQSGADALAQAAKAAGEKLHEAADASRSEL